MTQPASLEQRAVDRHLASYDVRTSHSIDVDAPATAAFRAARELDMGRSLPVIVLMAIRTIPHMLTGKTRPSRKLDIDFVLDAGFTVLEENPPRELVIGVVGKFWRPDSGLLRVTPEEFTSFDEPGYARAVLSVVVEERERGSWVQTETRVQCTDASARRKFSMYWRLIGPFSGLIRRLMLEQVKRTAERA